MSTLGERLRQARKRRGMSQMDVFDSAGISNKALSRYEKDVSAPSPEVIKKLSRLYDVSGEYLLGVTNEMGHSADNVPESDSLIYMNDQKGCAGRVIDFIASSPTVFHAAENIALRLSNEGFERLFEGEDWTNEKIRPGGRYFTVRNGSSLIAFKVGSDEQTGLNIYSAHCDSPMFKLKPSPELEAKGGYIRLNAEIYGGIAQSTWLDRPLSIAGRIVVNTPSGVKTLNVNLKDLTVVIPSVALHLTRQGPDSALNPQVDLIPLLGSQKAKGGLSRAIALASGVKPKDIISSELYVYNRTKGEIWGEDGEFFSSPRLDDMQCAYAGLQGFLNGGSEKRISMYCAFDNEEVGSSTKQGANSDFLTGTVERLCRALGKDRHALLANSFCVSADNSHAIHPSHPELSDPVNAPVMNGGVVIKHAARQSYATDAVSAAVFSKICRAAGVPVQTYANRSDIRGGGTLGNISATRVSVPTVDIGLAQLAMHSCYETAGSMDALYLERAVSAFFSTELEVRGDEIEIK